MSADEIVTTADTLRPFLVDLLCAESLFAFDAEAVVDAALRAEQYEQTHEDGVELVARILTQARSGEIDPRGRPLVIEEAPALLFLDGSSAAGPVAIVQATKWLLEKTPTLGVAVVVVKSGRDLGHPALALAPLAEAGLVALCSTSCYRAGDSRDAATRIGAAFATPEGASSEFFETDDHSVWAVTLSALANGHAPAAKASSTNPTAAEHVVVAIDPGRTTELSRLQRKLDVFDHDSRLRKRAHDEVILDGPLAKTLETFATKHKLKKPWNT